MTQPTPFGRPSGPGDKFDNHDHKGRLLIIYPKSYNPAATTSKGVNACADADIIVVDAPPQPDGRPLIFHDAKIFGNLAKSVRDSVGSKCLGRLDQVPTAGGNLAWVLNDWSDQEAAQAAPLDQAYAAGQFPKPQPTQQQPPAQGWGQQPPQQYQQPPAQPQQYGGPPAQQYPPQGQAWGQQPQAAPSGPPAGQPDLWAGQQQYAQQPPGQAPAQQQYGAPPPAGPEDPNVAALIAKGLPEAQVRAMDPQTRASVLATYGG